MEASYPVDRVTRFAGTMKYPSSYLVRPPFSRGEKTHALLAKVPLGLPSFPGKAFTW